MARDNPIIIGLDQGTTNVKAIALDREGRVLARATRPIATLSPQPGIVEQDADAMFATAVACIGEAIQMAGVTARHVAALGIANQTETLIVWDGASGKPVIPAMIWQDRRGAEEVETLRAEAQRIRERTGLDLDPTFTAAKLSWIARHRPEIASGLADGTLLCGKGSDDLDQVADQGMALGQQRIDVAEGGIGALVEPGDQRVLRAYLEHEPERDSHRDPDPPIVEHEIGRIDQTVEQANRFTGRLHVVSPMQMRLNRDVAQKDRERCSTVGIRNG